MSSVTDPYTVVIGGVALMTAIVTLTTSIVVLLAAVAFRSKVG